MQANHLKAVQEMYVPEVVQHSLDNRKALTKLERKEAKKYREHRKNKRTRFDF